MFNIYHLFFKQSNKQLTNRSATKPIGNVKIKIKPDEAFKLDSYEAIFKYLKKNIAK